MRITKRLATAPVLAGLILAGCSSGGSSLPVASSSTGGSSLPIASSPTRGLLASADAKGLGYPTIHAQPQASSKTGVAKCTKSASAAFQDQSAKTGLVTGVLVCNSVADATTVLVNIKKQATTSPQLVPPTDLGANALETTNRAPAYVIYWQNKSLVAFTALITDISSHPTHVTMTPAQQRTLSSAAQKQNSTIKSAS